MNLSKKSVLCTAIVIFTGCALVVGRQAGDANTAAAPPVASTAAAPVMNVTLTSFEQLQTGMSYAEVVAILGHEGELLATTECCDPDVAGLPDFTTVAYQWMGNADSPVTGANMNATFQNDALVSKAQYGLA